MARPRKTPSAKRDDQIVVYLHKIVGDALRREAQVRGVSVSTLAADILQGWIDSGGATIHVPDDTLYAVIRRLIGEGMLKEKILGNKSTPVIEGSAEFAPKTSIPAPNVSENVEQRGDDGGANVAPKARKKRGNQGGNSDDS